MNFAEVAALKLCSAPLAPTCCRQTAAASRGAQPAPPALPHVQHHAHKVHLCLRAELRPTHSSQHHLWRREHFLSLISHLLHTALLLLVLNLYHRLHPPANRELITSVKLTAGSSLTSTRAGININTVLGFCLYC